VRLELERLDSSDVLIADLSHEQVQKGGFTIGQAVAAELALVSAFPAN